MRLFELFEAGPKPDVQRIDVENEVAEKIFKTDNNGNPIIGQYIPGYEGINYQNLVAMARTAASKHPRQERKAIDDLVDAAIKKHLKTKKSKDDTPAPAKPAPVKSADPKKSDPEDIKRKSKTSDPSGKPLDINLKGKAGEVQSWLKKRIGLGTDLADKFSKVNKK